MPVTLTNLSAGYDRHPVVHHLNGQFQDASMTALIGPNGGGKSTLLKTLSGFLPLMTGEIDFGGITKKEIAYLPQQFEMDRTFPISVMDVVLLGHWPRLGALGPISRTHRDEAYKALDKVNMAAFVDEPIISLSTGQWQRVLFARLFLQRAKLILLDEPFAAIDGRTTKDLLSMLEYWQKQGAIIVCVLHDLNVVRDHFPKTLILARNLVTWGSTSEALQDKNLTKAGDLAEHWGQPAEVCKIGEDA